MNRAIPLGVLCVGLIITVFNYASISWLLHEQDASRSLPVEILLVGVALSFFCSYITWRFIRDSQRAFANQLQSTEENARKTKDILATLIDNLPVGIFLKDGRQGHFGTFRLWNKACENIFGMPAHDVLDHTGSESFPKEQMEMFLAVDRKVFEDRKAVDVAEEEGLSRTRGLRTLHTVKIPFFDSNGAPEYLVGFYEDITERKSTERALKDSEERVRHMIEGIKDYAIISLDRLGRITSWNLGASRIKGYSAEETLGKHFSLFHPPEDVDSGRVDQILLTAQQDSNFEEEGLRVKKDGSRFWARVVIAALKDKDGNLQGFTKVIQDISLRKAANDELKRINSYQTAILNNAGSAIITGTPEGIITSFNSTAEKLLGYSAEEMIGKLTPAIFHDRAEVIKRAQELSKELDENIEPGFEVFVAKARRNLPNNSQWTYIRKDGSRFPVLLSVTALRDSDGNIYEFLGIASDITARVKAENYLKLATSSSNVGIWEWDIVGNEVFWDDFMLTLYGREKATFINVYETWSSTLSSDDKERAENALWEAVKGGKPYDTTFTINRPDGETRFIKASGVVVDRGPNGDATRMMGTNVDITEQVSYAQKLAAQAHEIKDIKTALDEHSIVSITDVTGKITYVNDKFCELSKYTKDELIGQDHRIVNSNYHSKEFIRELWRTIAQGKVWQGAICNKAKDGSLYWVQSTMVPFLDNSGKPVQYISIRTDITQQKAIEAEVQRAQEIAHLATVAKSSFLANMSHEIRTPLTSIIGYSESMMTDSLNSQEQQHALTTVIKTALIF